MDHSGRIIWVFTTTLLLIASGPQMQTIEGLDCPTCVHVGYSDKSFGTPCNLTLPCNSQEDVVESIKRIELLLNETVEQMMKANMTTVDIGKTNETSSGAVNSTSGRADNEEVISICQRRNGVLENPSTEIQMPLVIVQCVAYSPDYSPNHVPYNSTPPTQISLGEDIVFIMDKFYICDEKSMNICRDGDDMDDCDDHDSDKKKDQQQQGGSPPDKGKGKGGRGRSGRRRTSDATLGAQSLRLGSIVIISLSLAITTHYQILLM